MSAFDLHRHAPYRAITLKRDQSPVGRAESGFRIECGAEGCGEFHEISGPPTLPPDQVMNKFKDKHWVVSDRGPRRNRCPTHARGERQTPAPRRQLTAADRLFMSPADLAAYEAAQPPTPAPAQAPAPKVKRPRIATPQAGPPPTPIRPRPPQTATTLKTQVFRQLGIDGDLDKIHRTAFNMLKLTRQHVLNLEALMLTIEDAQKRIGQQPEARRA